MTTPTPARLALLGALDDYRVCAEDTDPRGWNIVDAEGAPVGIAADLIVDLTGLVARYLVCAQSSREVLIPTGFARLEEAPGVVHLDFVTAADIDKLPSFTGLPLREEDAARLETALTGAAATPAGSARIVRRDIKGDAS